MKQSAKCGIIVYFIEIIFRQEYRIFDVILFSEMLNILEKWSGSAL